MKLKCLNRFIGVMLDRFGSSLRLFPADNEHFYLDVDVVVRSAVFSWVFSLEGDVRIVNPAGGLRKRLKSRFTNS